MTEAGEKWLLEQGINRSMYDAEKAIRAFVAEVEKKAAPEYRCDPANMYHHLGWELLELKTKLLGNS